MMDFTDYFATCTHLTSTTALGLHGVVSETTMVVIPWLDTALTL